MTTALYKVRLVQRCRGIHKPCKPTRDVMRAQQDMVAGHKDARGSLAVRSVVLRVLSVEGSAPLFPSPSSHHRCLLAIDPLLRHVTLFYHAFYPMM